MATTEELVEQADLMSPAVLALTGAAGVLSAAYLYKLFSGPAKVLPLDDFQHFPLIRKEVLSHDTRRFVFGLPSPNHILGLPVGQHLSLKFTDSKTSKAVQRSYTPTDDMTPGEVSLVVKVYRPLLPRFPDGGLMSQHLDDLKIGDTCLMRGPKGHVEWFMDGSRKFGTFQVKPLGKPAEERYTEQVGMIAGGTGITPMLQVLQSIFHRGKSSNICVRMIYANQSEDDILVREELEAFASEFPARFSLHYTVDRPPAEGWTHSTGHISPKMIDDHLMFADKSKPTQFFMCGPPPMLKFACLPPLEAAGFTASDWVLF